MMVQIWIFVDLFIMLEMRYCSYFLGVEGRCLLMFHPRKMQTELNIYLQSTGTKILTVENQNTYNCSQQWCNPGLGIGEDISKILPIFSIILNFKGHDHDLIFLPIF